MNVFFKKSIIFKFDICKNISKITLKNYIYEYNIHYMSHIVFIHDISDVNGQF